MERALEKLVWRRAGRRCEYCQVAQEHDPLPFEIDHVIAKKHRGPTRASNLCLACFACNNHKGPNVAGVDPKRKRSSRSSIRGVTDGSGTSAGKVRSWSA